MMDMKADISWWYDVRWDTYYQVKNNNTLDIVSNTDLAWDKLQFIIIFDPEKVNLDMGDLQYESLSLNIYKITMTEPIVITKFKNIATIWYQWDKTKINISDVIMYDGENTHKLSITNIP